MIIEPAQAGWPCFFCDQDAAYSIHDVGLCLLHFSVLRNEMMGLVLQEHAFVTRPKNDHSK